MAKYQQKKGANRMRNWNHILSIIAITLTTFWLFGMPGTAYCEDEVKQIEVEAKKIKNSDQPFNIKLATGALLVSWKTGLMNRKNHPVPCGLEYEAFA
jgi:hypothetical protein